MAVPESAGADNYWLPKQRRAEWANAIFAGGNAGGWPCFTQVERFTLDAPFITLEQRTENGLRCCRVRLPAVIAVRQCGEVALPVPGMRQRMAAGKAAIIRKTVAAESPAMQCRQLARAEQRRGATLIDGQTVAEKAAKAMAGLFTPKDAAMNISNCDNKSGECRNSELAGGAGFQRLYPGALED